ncbi:MAG: hypothetical protein QNI90_08880 [Dinoroseobacter sp.]|nr:hypothetical protein [Dinoroseobacter sp.]
MFPYWNFSPTIEYPLSGDVVQDIETTWFARMRGSPEVEYKIITEVWSYGDQLGTLTDALLDLAQEQDWPETPALKKLGEKNLEMKATKDALKAQIRRRAEMALEHLKSADTEAYDAVVKNAAATKD